MNNQNINLHTEANYLHKSLDMMLIILLLNIPIMLLTAYLNDTGLIKALLFSVAVVILPLIFKFTNTRGLIAQVSSAAALMFFSGLMIHFGKGMIEMHFHVFVSLAIVILLAEPMAVLAAAGTIALHHIGFYFLFPQSLFNYQAGFGIVVLHAVFVVVESIPAFIIAAKFKNLVVVQNKIIKNLDLVSQELDHVSESTIASSHQLSESAQSQSHALQKTASSMQEISSMVDSNLAAAKQAGEVVHQGVNYAEEGKNRMDQLMNQIDTMSQTNTQTAEELLENNSQLLEIKKIISIVADKTKIINEIVFQTKLLSFNASVEAARAGEAGKGFAVVAEEVGNLAKMSGSAADEIGQSVGQSIDKVEKLVNLASTKINHIIEHSKQQFSEAHVSAEQCQSIFSNIHDSVQDVSEKFKGIIIASEEQSKGLEVIKESLLDLEKISSEQDKLAEGSTQSMTLLKTKSEEVAELTESLKKAS